MITEEKAQRMLFSRSPRRRNSVHEHVLAVTDPANPLLESYRRLYKKVSYFQQEKNVKAIGVTSAAVGDGKTLTSINLALAAAEDSQNRVVIVDCDFRRPRVAGYLGISKQRGLADVLLAGADPMEVIVPVGRAARGDLRVLPMGKLPGDPEEQIYGLLYERKLEPLLLSLRQTFDFVIVDTPPVLPIVDMQYLSELLDGLILVIRAGKTSRDLVQDALETLEGRNIIGTVVNGISRQFSSRYRYGSYHYHYHPYARTRSRTQEATEAEPPASSSPGS